MRNRQTCSLSHLILNDDFDLLVKNILTVLVISQSLSLTLKLF